MKKHLDDVNKVIINLAFIDAISEVLGAFANQALQTTAEVNTQTINNIREAINTGTADSAIILNVVKQMNETALVGVEQCASVDVFERIQKLRAGTI